jgi:predicted AAA+ superfamily ATPase
MLERKFNKLLLEWKTKPRKMALLVKGDRQVGKTFTIMQFAEKQYQNFVYINFDENPAYRIIFDGDLDMATLPRMAVLTA